MAVEPIKVTGLKEFRDALKKMDKDLPKVLRISFNRAADIIVDEARPKVPTRTGRARASIKTRSTQTEVRVVGGSKRVPYYPWLDFGGTIGTNGPRRPFLKNGRYIYDAYFRNRDEFTDILVDELVSAGSSVGLQVDRSGG